MSVFVDTSAFAALENRRDRKHRAAVRVYRALLDERTPLITSDYIFDETITLLTARATADIAAGWARRLLASSVFEMHVIDRDLLERALAIFEGARDQKFSFTDCSSFALMRAQKIETAFAFDEDFQRFGFLTIPRKA